MHVHKEITNEIRRELANAKCRDLELNDDANSQHSIDLNFDDNNNLEWMSVQVVEKKSEKNYYKKSIKSEKLSDLKIF